MSKNSRGRRVELEAAEALAALAHISTTNRRGKSNDFVGGEEFERPSQRAKINIDSSTAHISDQSGVIKQPSDTGSSVITNSVRADQELVRMSNRDHVSAVCSKSRQQLTEAEREERRIRRVLANRESARQTIRRRQAMYEELTKNTSDLTMENENLKTKKEQALKEYNSLKSMNERLKALGAKLNNEEEENRRHTDLTTRAKATASSAVAPYLLCSQQSIVPFIWPSLLQSSVAFQLPSCSCQKCISKPSQIHVPLVSHNDSEKEKHELMSSTGNGAPICVLPLPWFFPFQMQCITRNAQPSDQYLHCGHAQNEQACLHALGTRSSTSKSEVCAKKHHDSLPSRNGGGSYGTDRTDFKTTPGDYCAGISASSQPSHKLQPGADSATASWGGVNGMSRQSEEPLACPPKKSAGAAMAAAEARRRRKELTKLKTLYYCRNYRTR